MTSALQELGCFLPLLLSLSVYISLSSISIFQYPHFIFILFFKLSPPLNITILLYYKWPLIVATGIVAHPQQRVKRYSLIM